MRINWFSPLLPEQTDIAHYTARIAPALMSAFDVTFWTDLPFDKARMPVGAKIRPFDPERIHSRDNYADLLNATNLYNYGNDARFHAGIFRLARQFPGVAILHDTRLHHFIFELYRSQTWAGYLDLAQTIYGSKGLEIAKSIVASDGRDIDAHVETMPFTEAMLDTSASAVCHSAEAFNDIQRCSNVPAMALALPFASLSRAPTVKRNWGPPWRFIMFGYVNPNRRLESILRALSNERGRMDFRLDIYGTLWDRPMVDRLISECHLSGLVKVHGFVSEQELDDAIAASHLAFNLRAPTMGEASGGILRSWTQATPAVVTNAGWYATLPDEIAPKISAEDELDDLSALFQELRDNPSAVAEIGTKAQAYAQRLHSPEAYVSSLKRALENGDGAMARLAACRALESIANRSRSIKDRALMLERARQAAAKLFAAEP